MEVDADAPTERDYVLARLAVARVSAMAAIESIDDCTALFVDPEDDEDGAQRKEALEAALEQLGCATRAAEAAEEAFDGADMAEVEPWDADAEAK